MGSMVSGLADAVLGVAEGVGLSSDTIARYGKCCEAVVEFCDRRDVDVLSVRVVEEFVACQQERARRGEIGPNRRKALVRSARMMLEFQRTGAVAWRVMSPALIRARASVKSWNGSPLQLDWLRPGNRSECWLARFATSWSISTGWRHWIIPTGDSGASSSSQPCRPITRAKEPTSE
jgi:hypothetical protein